MKICIGVNESRDGYTNVGFVKNLDAFAENGECDEVLAVNILEYITCSHVEDFLVHLASKVAHGGKIVVGGVDYMEIAKMAIRQDFSIGEFNRLLYGTGSQPKESAININVVTGVLQSHGFKIIKKRLNGYEFSVEATRL